MRQSPHPDGASCVVARRLGPAEDLFNSFALSLTHLVASMPHGAGINRTATLSLVAAQDKYAVRVREGFALSELRGSRRIAGDLDESETGRRYHTG